MQIFVQLKPLNRNGCQARFWNRRWPWSPAKVPIPQALLPGLWRALPFSAHRAPLVTIATRRLLTVLPQILLLSYCLRISWRPRTVLSAASVSTPRRIKTIDRVENGTFALHTRHIWCAVPSRDVARNTRALTICYGISERLMVMLPAKVSQKGRSLLILETELRFFFAVDFHRLSVSNASFTALFSNLHALGTWCLDDCRPLIWCLDEFPAGDFRKW